MKMRNEIIFVLVEGFADWESSFLSALITNGGLEPKKAKYQVKTLAISKAPVATFGGFKVVPDYDMLSLPDEYAALILIGGRTWKDKNAEPFRQVVEDAIGKKRLIGAICDGSLFLGMNGFLNHIRHTSNEVEDLKRYSGGKYTGEKLYLEQQVVEDNRIVTANGTAFLEFAKIIATILEIDSKENIERFYWLYKEGQYPE